MFRFHNLTCESPLFHLQQKHDRTINSRRLTGRAYIGHCYHTSLWSYKKRWLITAGGHASLSYHVDPCGDLPTTTIKKTTSVLSLMVKKTLDEVDTS